MGNRAERQERETESNRLVWREKEHLLEMVLRSLEMAVSEMEHLSIFISINQ